MKDIGPVEASGSASTLNDAARAVLATMAKNFERWIAVLAPPPRWRDLLPSVPAIGLGFVTLIIVALSMVYYDTAASDWARSLPQWFRNIFEKITDFGLSGWFLFPSGFLLLALAALISPRLSRMSQGVLAALAVRIGFIFLAIAVPGLFVTIIKRLIGRARPYVGSHDDPFAYMPFAWRPEYASMPSGHATTAVAAALAIGAIWPRTRPVMWVYAAAIVFSRVVVLAHHPSDVIAGALVGAAGANLLRRWFAARRLLFSARDLAAFPGPGWRRIGVALQEALSAPTPAERKIAGD